MLKLALLTFVMSTLVFSDAKKDAVPPVPAIQETVEDDEKLYRKRRGGKGGKKRRRGGNGLR